MPINLMVIKWLVYSGGPSEIAGAFNELHFNFANGVTLDSNGEANLNSFIGNLSDFSIDFSYMEAPRWCISHGFNIESKFRVTLFHIRMDLHKIIML